MANSQAILALIMVAVTVGSWIASTFKTGIVGFSPSALVKAGETRYVVNEKKRKQYYTDIVIALLFNIIVAIIFTREIAGIALFTVYNMIFITYALRYLVLLDKKSK